MSNEYWSVDSKDSLDAFMNFVKESYDKNQKVTFQWTLGGTRTKQQNKALHVYCRNLAAALSDAGLDMKKTIKPEVELPWSDDLVKQFLWRPIQKAVTGKESTAHLKKEEYNQVYEVLNRHLADKFGVSVPFPQSEP